MVNVVSASGVVKTFGAGRAARRVLDGAAIEVAPGEVVAVQGRSGSGKSTLLHLLGGLDRADSGRIEVGGLRVDGAKERTLDELRRRHVGFVFQFFHLIPELTGAENLLLPARLLNANGSGSPERVRELIERLGLEQAAERLPHTLSGGEQQRLAIARALVGDPAVVLADEPTGNLDSEAARTVLGLLGGLREHGPAVVLVTHDREAARIADRVLHLRDGRLVP